MPKFTHLFVRLSTKRLIIKLLAIQSNNSRAVSRKAINGIPCIGFIYSVCELHNLKTDGPQKKTFSIFLCYACALSYHHRLAVQHTDNILRCPLLTNCSKRFILFVRMDLALYSAAAAIASHHTQKPTNNQVESKPKYTTSAIFN